MKYLIIRFGGLGDQLFIEPVIRYLKKQGHTIYFSTTERGRDMMANNPNIEKILFTKDGEVENIKLKEHWSNQAKEVGADKVINFSESIEEALLRHPLNPKYNDPKYKRIAECDVNAFDQSFKVAGIDPLTVKDEDKLPMMYYTQEEEEWMEKFFSNYRKENEIPQKFFIMWAVSGSGINKVYPYQMNVMRTILQKYPNVMFITVGDEVCKLMEMDIQTCPEATRVINMSGEWSPRKSMLAIKHCGLVISPETGILVASGQYNIPKIGMLSAITKNHVVRYFKNDHSICANGIGCSPCFKMIYHKFQCPIGFNGGVICQEEGFDVDRVIKRIEDVLAVHYGGFKI